MVVDTFVSDRVLQKITEFNEKTRMNATAKKPFKPIEVSDDGLELIEYLSLDCSNTQGEWHSDSEIKIDKNGYVIRNGEKTKEFWDGTIYGEKKPLRLKIRNICGDETEWGYDMRKQKTKELVNTEWVERIAVNRLESALLSTGLVVPTIPTGDKAPSWMVK